jgi:hypothetical protein
MNKTLSILASLLLIPCATFGQAQQTDLDQLIEGYDVKRRVASQPQDLESENRKLKSQIIDLRVEKDALNEKVAYLEAVIANHEASETGVPAECHDVTCVPLADVQQEKVITYVIYSLGLYRLAELLDQAAPRENVEAHRKAQKIMVGVKSDLEVLGFDTSDMSGLPELDELLEELEIAQGPRLTQ